MKSAASMSFLGMDITYNIYCAQNYKSETLERLNKGKKTILNMQFALKFVVTILILIVITIVIICLLSVWTGQSSDIVSGIINFFKGMDPSNLGEVFE
jgi:hypothetical protein